MKCGNCKGQHETAQEVKDCYALGTPVAKEVVCVLRAPSEQPITNAQKSYLFSLAEQRPKIARRIKSIDTLTKDQASSLIQEALSMPAEEGRVEIKEPKVPEGYYAIDIGGTVKFYRVRIPEDGKWKGRVFVDVQASDDFYPIRNIETKKEVLRAILKQGVKESQARYGKEIGRCGICNRTLTDETSISIGIGPVCMARWGI
jgi:Family of unknown function (DUF6011)